MSPIEIIEETIIDEFAGRITRAEAVDRVRAVVRVTEAGAIDLLTHAVAPRKRYQRALGDRT